MNSTSDATRDPTSAARLQGLVSGQISQKRVLIVGCGSVGSNVAGELCRAGVSDFVLVDPDVVEWPNLSRTIYGHADIGCAKVEALKRHLLQIYPDVAVRSHRKGLQEFDSKLSDLIGAADLAIGAVDDPRASGMLDRFSYALGVPVVHVGIYRGAQGGEIVAVRPGQTPCRACATGGVREAVAGVTQSAPVERGSDYGTGRLQSEIALGSDIHFVCAAAVKIALSLLALDEPDGAVSNLLREKLAAREHFVMFGMAPDYFIFPATHANAIGQHAFQSVWLQTSSRPDCPRCGEDRYRETPV